MAEPIIDPGPESFGGKLLESPAPFLLAALGPAGAAAGLGAMMFGGARRRQRMTGLREEAAATEEKARQWQAIQQEQELAQAAAMAEQQRQVQARSQQWQAIRQQELLQQLPTALQGDLPSAYALAAEFEQNGLPVPATLAARIGAQQQIETAAANRRAVAAEAADQQSELPAEVPKAPSGFINVALPDGTFALQPQPGGEQYYQREQELARMDSSIETIDELITLVQEGNQFEQALPGFLGGDPEVSTRMTQLYGEIIAAVAEDRGMGALGDEEREFLLEQFPDPTSLFKADATVTAPYERLRRTLEKRRQSMYRAALRQPPDIGEQLPPLPPGAQVVSE